MKTTLLTLAAILLVAASNASAAQVCGFATCTSTTTNTTTITQGNTQTQVQACTGNIIVQVSMDDSNACSGWNQTAANCQTNGFQPDCGGAATPGVLELPGDGRDLFDGIRLEDSVLDGILSDGESDGSHSVAY